MVKTKEKCTNCGKENKGVWFASPTTDEKRRNQCLSCANPNMSKKEYEHIKKVIGDGMEDITCKHCGVWPGEEHKRDCLMLKVKPRDKRNRVRIILTYGGKDYTQGFLIKEVYFKDNCKYLRTKIRALAKPAVRRIMHERGKL